MQLKTDFESTVILPTPVVQSPVSSKAFLKESFSLRKRQTPTGQEQRISCHDYNGLASMMEVTTA